MSRGTLIFEDLNTRNREMRKPPPIIAEAKNAKSAFQENHTSLNEFDSSERKMFGGSGVTNLLPKMDWSPVVRMIGEYKSNVQALRTVSERRRFAQSRIFWIVCLFSQYIRSASHALTEAIGYNITGTVYNPSAPIIE
jgi:hypothetical protein